MPAQQWAHNFKIVQDDIDFLTSLLLEKEQPLTTEVLAHILIEERLEREAAALQERFKDARFYNPAEIYEIGQRVIFPIFNYASALVKDQRDGFNPDYETFNVIQVEFEDEEIIPAVREFASALTEAHALSRSADDEVDNNFLTSNLSADEIMAVAGDDILYTLETSLSESGSLIQVSGVWFPEELMVEVNVGHTHLAEAILDMNGGGPLATIDILENIGGLDSGSSSLQEFSLNHTLKNDNRFDEVGPKGQVLWYLNRLEPAEVQHTPPLLNYQPIDYDPTLLDEELLALEREINDELSEFTYERSPETQARATIIYPHRRAGTLPLNLSLQNIFPTEQQTERVFVTLIDGQDGENYPGWVVRKGHYIFGLNKFYRKHQLPIGVHLNISIGDDLSQFVVNFDAYRPRTEWVRIVVPKNGQITFEDAKRSIGADYDDLMILGADDLDALDNLFNTVQQQRKPLTSILHNILVALGPLTPQGTVHAKTIYSAVNLVRRCPPGPILATLVANLDFQNVGGHYWKLSDH